MEPEYIERKALDKALTAAAAHDKDKNRRTWAKAICILHDLPAADVVPVVHSYWEHKITSYGEIVSSCHNCKYPVSQFWELAKYCPNCGARMDGGNENDR